MSIEGALAVHRFGLGARPGEIETASQNPHDWLTGQLDGPADQPVPVGDARLMSAGELVVEERDFREKQKALKQASDNGQDKAEARKALNKTRQEIVVGEMAARFLTGFTTERPFAERLVWFWTNHFSVSTAKPQSALFAGAFEREVVRPNITGKFETMVQAAMRHPGMLLYLDNAQSIGPDSPAGARTGKGLNENLGRELMELYTLGVDGGYTQADVIAMAKLLTGFSIDRDGGGENGFRYYRFRHEPGSVTLRGKSYGSDEEATRQAISDLCADPATARHIAGKFAQAFLADEPSKAQVKRLEEVFRKTGGDLRALAQAVTTDPAAFSPKLSKVRSPVEYVTATFRLLNLPKAEAPADVVMKQVRAGMGGTRLMGEFPMSALSPKGWPLDSAAWSGPDAVLNRIEWARQVAQRVPPTVDIPGLAADALGPLLSENTATQLGRAASKQEAVALLIASPEFQRR